MARETSIVSRSDESTVASPMSTPEFLNKTLNAFFNNESNESNKDNFDRIDVLAERIFQLSSGNNNKDLEDYILGLAKDDDSINDDNLETIAGIVIRKNKQRKPQATMYISKKDKNGTSVSVQVSKELNRDFTKKSNKSVIAVPMARSFKSTNKSVDRSAKKSVEHVEKSIDRSIKTVESENKSTDSSVSEPIEKETLQVDKSTLHEELMNAIKSNIEKESDAKDNDNNNDNNIEKQSVETALEKSIDEICEKIPQITPNYEGIKEYNEITADIRHDDRDIEYKMLQERLLEKCTDNQVLRRRVDTLTKALPHPGLQANPTDTTVEESSDESSAESSSKSSAESSDESSAESCDESSVELSDESSVVSSSSSWAPLTCNDSNMLEEVKDDMLTREEVETVASIQEKSSFTQESFAQESFAKNSVKNEVREITQDSVTSTAYESYSTSTASDTTTDESAVTGVMDDSKSESVASSNDNDSKFESVAASVFREKPKSVANSVNEDNFNSAAASVNGDNAESVASSVNDDDKSESVTASVVVDDNKSESVASSVNDDNKSESVASIVNDNNKSESKVKKVFKFLTNDLKIPMFSNTQTANTPSSKVSSKESIASSKTPSKASSRSSSKASSKSSSKTPSKALGKSNQEVISVATSKSSKSSVKKPLVDVKDLKIPSFKEIKASTKSKKSDNGSREVKVVNKVIKEESQPIPESITTSDRPNRTSILSYGSQFPLDHSPSNKSLIKGKYTEAQMHDHTSTTCSMELSETSHISISVDESQLIENNIKPVEAFEQDVISIDSKNNLVFERRDAQRTHERMVENYEPLRRDSGSVSTNYFTVASFDSRANHLAAPTRQMFSKSKIQSIDESYISEDASTSEYGTEQSSQYRDQVHQVPNYRSYAVDDNVDSEASTQYKPRNSFQRNATVDSFEYKPERLYSYSTSYTSNNDVVELSSSSSNDAKTKSSASTSQSGGQNRERQPPDKMKEVFVSSDSGKRYSSISLTKIEELVTQGMGDAEWVRLHV